MAEIILVTGGARSGKSSFAERLAARGHSVAYIATAQVLDEEMHYRVRLHRERRPGTWTTYEAPFHAGDSLREAGRKHDTILFDCLTVYLSNVVCALTERQQCDEAQAYAAAEAAIDELKEALESLPEAIRVIFVTNEVGDGIVPINHMARLYRDLSGLMNQRIAALADKVYLVCCGIPVDLKRLEGNI